MMEVSFNYKSVNTIIQCNINDKTKDIIDKFLLKIENKENNLLYLYNGDKINDELKFNELANESDKSRQKMNIVVYNNNEDQDEKNEIISKDIICPKCKEDIFINFKDFKIDLNGCKSNHNTTNIILDKFKETQKINLNNIICDICKLNNKSNTHNNVFYLCLTCKKNICPLCKSIHDKSHIIIDYDEKNYVCNKHNDSFNKYCKTCNENICILCENDHCEHDFIDLGKMLINKNDLLKINDYLKISIDKFKYKINIIVEIFKRMADILDIYYKINNDIIHNYNMNKRNYYKLINLNNLKMNNEKIIKDINSIIDNNKISEIYGFSFNNFYNENGEIYFGETKNNLKEGKGMLFYDKNDEFNRKSYDGDFKNDKANGNGVLLWNSGNLYEGDFKDDKKEGKGIYYWNNGNKYVGDFINDKFEGKGILYYNNGNKYEGDYKSGKKEGKGIYYYNNGYRYEGDFKNNNIEGKGIYYYNNGNRYEGDFLNNKFEGNGILYYKNGKVIKGIWKNGKCLKKEV